MKIYFTLILFCVLALVSAQGIEADIDGIAKSEMRLASKKMSFLTNPNTQNYDISYHKLEFTVDPSINYISGVVTTAFTALTDLSTITFDLTNQLTVSSVTKEGLDLSFTQTDTNELVITLPNTLNSGTVATVSISYSGTPPSQGTAFTTATHSGAPILYTLSEPYGARDWWPCKQDLNDKTDSLDVYITAPKKYISVSNGVEPEPAVINRLNKTTHFHHSYPIPAYLIAIAVTNYSVYNQTGGTVPNQYPIINYIYPETLALVSVQTQLDQTPLILNLFESLFEIYPFHTEKYGHAQFGWGGGMEHTTVSFMNNFNRGLIAHEAAHQWFGDKVTCGTWKDIWLNEGFATYLASLVIEKFDGQAAFIANKTSMVNSVTSISTGAVYLSDSDLQDVNRIFDRRLTYFKGAMVLNMLRLKLGGKLFFKGIKNYLADPKLAYKYALTADFQSHLEAVYGSSLSEFFNDWIFNQGYPSYTINTENQSDGIVKFTINQVQSDPSVSFFEMPVPIRILLSNGQQMDLVLNNTINGEVFLENVPFAVTSVVFDPNSDLISKNNKTTLGLNKLGLESIKLYPNPTNNSLSLDLPGGVTLSKTVFHNGLGQKILETGSATQWDVASLPAGVYFISLFTDYGTKKVQFVKK
jgi:aminopeptidase N